MSLTKTERELVELRKKGANAPRIGWDTNLWTQCCRNWGISALITGAILLLFVSSYSWGAYLVNVSLPWGLYGLSRVIIRYCQLRRRRRALSVAYLTPGDLPSSLPYDFRDAYRKVGSKGTEADREQLRQLCTHVTLEALRLKAAGVSLEKPALSAWLTNKYTQATELSQYIIDFDTTVKESLAEEAARRKARIAQAAEDAALAAFWVRNVEGPIDAVQWTTEGLRDNTRRLKLVRGAG